MRRPLNRRPLLLSPLVLMGGPILSFLLFIPGTGAFYVDPSAYSPAPLNGIDNNKEEEEKEKEEEQKETGHPPTRNPVPQGSLRVEVKELPSIPRGADLPESKERRTMLGEGGAPIEPLPPSLQGIPNLGEGQNLSERKEMRDVQQWKSGWVVAPSSPPITEEKEEEKEEEEEKQPVLDSEETIQPTKVSRQPNFNRSHIVLKGRPMSSPKCLVIHWTGNQMKRGENPEKAALRLAKANARYNQGNNRNVNWHYTVGPNITYLGVPDNRRGAHMGRVTPVKTNSGPFVCNNSNSIGVEHSQPINHPVYLPSITEESAALISYILKKYPSIKMVAGHGDFQRGRNCPGHYPWGLVKEILEKDPEVKKILGKIHFGPQRAALGERPPILNLLDILLEPFSKGEGRDLSPWMEEEKGEENKS